MIGTKHVGSGLVGKSAFLVSAVNIEGHGIQTMNAFRTTYPTLCELLAGTPFEADAAAAAEFAKSKEDMNEPPHEW